MISASKKSVIASFAESITDFAFLITDTKVDKSVYMCYDFSEVIN